MKQRLLLILSHSKRVIAVNETPCQNQFLVAASLVFAISFHAVPRNALRLLLFTGSETKFCHFLGTGVDGSDIRISKLDDDPLWAWCASLIKSSFSLWSKTTSTQLRPLLPRCAVITWKYLLASSPNVAEPVFFIICTTAMPSMTYAVDILTSTGSLGSPCTCS